MAQRSHRFRRSPWAAALVVLAVAFTSLQPSRALAALAGAEYFVDVDPGEGLAVAIPAPLDGVFDGTSETVEITNLDTSSLTIGPHTLYLRMRDDAGVWGEARPFTFDPRFTSPHNLWVTGERGIRAAEYFFDSDPGPGGGTALACTDGDCDAAWEGIELANLSAAALGPGPHVLYLRMQNQDGTWGPARGSPLEIHSLPPVGGGEVWVSGGACQLAAPAEGSGTAFAALDGAFDETSEEMVASLSLAGRPAGVYELCVRACSGRGEARLCEDPASVGLLRWGAIRSQHLAVGGPALAVLPPLAQQVGGQGRVPITARIEDAAEANDGTLRIEYASQGEPWRPATLDPASLSVPVCRPEPGSPQCGNPTVRNGSLPQIGSPAGWILTSLGPVALGFDWLSGTDLPGLELASVRLRLSFASSSGEAVIETEPFALDNHAPGQPAPLPLPFDSPSADWRPELRWQRVSTARSYRVQILQQPSCSVPALYEEEFVPENLLASIVAWQAPSPLPPIALCWRVTALDAAGNPSAASDGELFALTTDFVSPGVALTYARDPAQAGPLQIRATFTEPVTGPPMIAVNRPGTEDDGDGAAPMAGQGRNWTFSYPVAPANGTTRLDGLVVVTVTGAVDAAERPNTPASNASFAIDTSAAGASTILAAEYFIDRDPGEGNGIPASTSEDGAFDGVVETVSLGGIDTSGLTIGPHTVFVRMMDANGAWGIARPLGLDPSFTSPHNLWVTGARAIQAAEWFIGADPGPGSGENLICQDGVCDEAEEDLLLSGAALASLSPGWHTIQLRMKNQEGAWGPARAARVEIFEPAVITAAEAFVTPEAECAAGDPGQGTGVVLAPTDGRFDSALESAMAAAVGVGAGSGARRVCVRMRDSFGRWGLLADDTLTVATHLYGGLRDQATGQPVAGAVVSLDLDGPQSTRTQSTGSPGSFSFADLSDGSYTLRVAHVNYESLQRAGSIIGGNSVDLGWLPLQPHTTLPVSPPGPPPEGPPPVDDDGGGGEPNPDCSEGSCPLVSNPISLSLSIARHYGPIQAGAGATSGPIQVLWRDAAIANGMMEPTAELTVEMFDLDLGESYTVDVNGLGGICAGIPMQFAQANQTWIRVHARIPVDCLLFPAEGPAAGPGPTPTPNLITLAPQQPGTEAVVSWASLGLNATAPVLLVHGKGSNSLEWLFGGSEFGPLVGWDVSFAEELKARGVLTERVDYWPENHPRLAVVSASTESATLDYLDNDANGTVDEAGELNFTSGAIRGDHLPGIDSAASSAISERWNSVREQMIRTRNRFGVNRVNLVAHSMGGLVSRMYALSAIGDALTPDVDNLVMLGTPNAGTSLSVVCAKHYYFCNIWKLDSPATRWLAPLAVANMFRSEAEPPGMTRYRTVAGGIRPTIGSPPELEGIPEPVHWWGNPVNYTPSSGWWQNLKARLAYDRLWWSEGANDSLVSSQSAHAAPGGIPLATFPRNHHALRTDQEVFCTVEASLRVTVASNPICPPASPASSAPQATVAEPTMAGFDLRVGFLAPGETLVLDWALPAAASVQATLLWDPASEPLSVTLRDPGGVVVPPTAFDLGIATFTVVFPAFGFWSIELDASAVSGETGYELHLSIADDTVSLSAQVEPLSTVLGQITSLQATFADAGLPIVGGVATAEITPPIGLASTVALSDNGLPPDAIAFDGIYSGEYVPTEIGIHHVQVSASGWSGLGLPVERIAVAEFGVRSGAVVLAGAITEATDDPDTDLLIDRLRIQVPVELLEPGFYEAAAHLTDGAGTEVARISLDPEALLAGPHVFDFPFDGRAIRDAGLPGPYTVAEVRIWRAGEGVDDLRSADVYLTAPYSPLDFERDDAILLASPISSPIDQNGNGLFEVLTILLDLDLTVGGSYAAMADLVDVNGLVVASTRSEHLLTPGSNSLELHFSGAEIQAAAGSGALSLTNLRLAGVAGATETSLPGSFALVDAADQPILASFFETQPPYAPEFFAITPEIDGLAFSWIPAAAGPAASGYRVYVGRLPGVYDQSFYVDAAFTTGSIVLHEVGTLYHAAVTALGSTGGASDFSNEAAAQILADTDGDLTPDITDNCPIIANASQSDADADGIGNACECGDQSGDGRVNTIDANLIQRCSVGEFPCTFLCDVTGEGTCNTIDARIVQRLAVGELTKQDLSCAARP